MDTTVIQSRIRENVLVDPVTGCWNWQRARTQSGTEYGIICVKRKLYTAHRMSYKVFNGPIPEGLHVLHKCHNKQCCNPEHLKVGTAKENYADSRETTLAAQRKAAAARPPKPTPEATMERKRRELGQRIAEAGNVPDEFKHTALLFASGMSYAEVAANLGVPIGTVRSRISRVKEML